MFKGCVKKFQLKTEKKKNDLLLTSEHEVFNNLH